jgi:hypoxanthine phosphoribosyltransferase
VIQDTQAAVVQFSWSDTDRITRDLATKLKANQYEAEAIIAILRGGCIPAVHLAHLLEIRSFYTIYLQTTISNQIRAERQFPTIINYSSLESIRGKRVLLVDDVTNTGSTLCAANEFLKQYGPSTSRSCVLVWDTVPRPGMVTTPDIVADYYGEALHAWVNFPWEM